jgi:hypothetical protein
MFGLNVAFVKLIAQAIGESRIDQHKRLVRGSHAQCEPIFRLRPSHIGRRNTALELQQLGSGKSEHGNCQHGARNEDQ